MNNSMLYQLQTRKKPTRQQKRYLKILKRLGYIQRESDVNKNYNSTTIGIRGAGKTTRLAAMVLYDLADPANDDNMVLSLVFVNHEGMFKNAVNTITALARQINVYAQAEYGYDIFDITPSGSNWFIYINGHRIDFRRRFGEHINRGLNFQEYKKIFIDEFSIPLDKEHDVLEDILIYPFFREDQQMKLHLFGTDEGICTYEIRVKFKKLEIPMIYDVLSIDRLNYCPSVKMNTFKKFYYTIFEKLV